MSVTSGQYFIKQTKRYYPYFSGKPQIVEHTFDNFQTEGNLVKRTGYFSSSSVAPYADSFDGFFLEDDGTTKRIRAYNKGVSTLNVAMVDWDNYELISAYDWSKFTVLFWEFLWLGGAVMKLWLDVPGRGFTLCHTFIHAGTGTGTIYGSPNQPARYEIRSTTGAGSLRYICSQIATEGSVDESGKTITIRNQTLTTTNSVGTIYFLAGVRKLAAFRDTPIKINKFGCGTGGTSDNGILVLLLAPTITGTPPVWTTSQSGRFQFSVNTNVNQVITAGSGREISALPVSTAGNTEILIENFLVWLSSLITDISEEYILGYIPLTINQSVMGIITLKEY